MSAAQLLVSSRRCRSEVAFAALAGASPLQASSGKITRHPLNRFGDRPVPLGEPAQHSPVCRLPRLGLEAVAGRRRARPLPGVYEWDGPRRAEAYARALWRVLALVSVPGSIHYVVLPGLRRDELLARPQLLADGADAAPWWRMAEVS